MTQVAELDERALERSRAELDLFERKGDCALRGTPFVPTAAEQELLDRIDRQREARHAAEPTKADRERARDLEMAHLMELELANHERALRRADLADGRTDVTEVATNNLRERIAELRKEK